MQLGYDAAGQAIVFVPEIVDGMLAVPQQGSRIEHTNLQYLKLLKVPRSQTQPGETDVH